MRLPPPPGWRLPSPQTLIATTVARRGRQVESPEPAAALAYRLAAGQVVWEADPVADADVNALLAGPTLSPDRIRRVVEGVVKQRRRRS
jgi:hypothetical protein